MANDMDVRIATLALIPICPKWVKLPILFGKIHGTILHPTNHQSVRIHRLETIEKTRKILKELNRF